MRYWSAKSIHPAQQYSQGIVQWVSTLPLSLLIAWLETRAESYYYEYEIKHLADTTINNTDWKPLSRLGKLLKGIGQSSRTIHQTTDEPEMSRMARVYDAKSHNLFTCGLKNHKGTVNNHKGTVKKPQEHTTVRFERGPLKSSITVRGQGKQETKYQQPHQTGVSGAEQDYKVLPLSQEFTGRSHVTRDEVTWHLTRSRDNSVRRSSVPSSISWWLAGCCELLTLAV